MFSPNKTGSEEGINTAYNCNENTNILSVVQEYQNRDMHWNLLEGKFWWKLDTHNINDQSYLGLKSECEMSVWSIGTEYDFRKIVVIRTARQTGFQTNQILLQKNNNEEPIYL